MIFRTDYSCFQKVQVASFFQSQNFQLRQSRRLNDRAKSRSNCSMFLATILIPACVTPSSMEIRHAEPSGFLRTHAALRRPESKLVECSSPAPTPVRSFLAPPSIQYCCFAKRTASLPNCPVSEQKTPAWSIQENALRYCISRHQKFSIYDWPCYVWIKISKNQLFIK